MTIKPALQEVLKWVIWFETKECLLVKKKKKNAY